MSSDIPTKYGKSKDPVVKAFGLNHTEYISDIHLLYSFLSFSKKITENTSSEKDKTDLPMFYSKGEFHGQINYAFVIFLFTMLERRARILCKILKDSGPELSVGLSNLSGSFLKRLKVFSTRIAKVEFQTKQHWEVLHSFQKVRDCIVHAGGFVPESSDENSILQMINTDKALSLSEDDFIVLKDGFCEKILKAVVIFLDDFTDEVHRYVKRRIRRQKKAESKI